MSQAWKLFSFWYKENYLTDKKDKKIHKIFEEEELDLLNSRYSHAFFWNSVIHLGLLWVMLYWGVSKHALQEVKLVPWSARAVLCGGLPPLSAYFRFQDLFYDSQVLEIASKYSDRIN
mmetsp:Transcript_7595/g.11183  ORF Transcript_7595/g.11183 Transcript_7595/m.11183 type:complete len:118 (-) Transcript_7595:582-935(-)